MIKTYNKEIIIKIFSMLLYYYKNNKYSNKKIEEIICDSYIVTLLENGDDSFLKDDAEIIVSKLIGISNIKYDYDTLSLWVINAYLELFFYFKRSFQFIFLYIPLDNMYKLYNLYHEMDISQLFDYFAKTINSNNLIHLLLKRNKLSVRKLSILTGISFNTINNYTKKNINYKKISFENLLKISRVLNVKPNIFIELSLFSDSSIFKFDKDNYDYQNIYSQYIIKYFDYSFFKNKNNVVNFKLIKDLNSFNDCFSSSKINVFCYYGNNRDEILKSILSKSNNKKIYFIDNQSLSIIKNKRIKKCLITDSIYKYIMNISKSEYEKLIKKKLYE